MSTRSTSATAGYLATLASDNLAADTSIVSMPMTCSVAPGSGRRFAAETAGHPTVWTPQISVVFENENFVWRHPSSNDPDFRPSN